MYAILKEHIVNLDRLDHVTIIASKNMISVLYKSGLKVELLYTNKDDMVKDFSQLATKCKEYQYA